MDNLLICSSGLVDRQRNQRPSYSTVVSIFNKEKDPIFNAGSYSERTPLIYIIMGIILCLIILYLINRFKRFREYLFRAFLRPYNFYADIRDQRIISNVQTLLLGLVISITFSLFTTSVFYYYKSSETAQYIYMLLLPFTFIQEYFYNLIWSPELFVITLSILLFGLIFLISLIIKLFSFFVKGRIFYTDTYTITIWSAVPVLLLLPFTIVLNKLLMLAPDVIWLIILILIIIIFWILFRIIRATAVVFDIRPMYSYIFGFSFIALIITLLISIYQIQFSLFSYTQYLFSVLLNY